MLAAYYTVWLLYVFLMKYLFFLDICPVVVMRRGDPLPQAFQAPVDVHASADGQVYLFRHRKEKLDNSSEDEEPNVMELWPRSRESSSWERERTEVLLLERDVSHEDNLNKLALQYGCKVFCVILDDFFI